LRQPLGVSIVGGLIVSQALTLFTTPVVYLFFEHLRRRFAAWRQRWMPSRRRHRALGSASQPA